MKDEYVFHDIYPDSMINRLPTLLLDKDITLHQPSIIDKVLLVQ